MEGTAFRRIEGLGEPGEAAWQDPHKGRQNL